MAKVPNEPLFPNLGPPGVARQIAEVSDGVALKFAAHPVGDKLHGNRSIHKAAVETVEVEGRRPLSKKRGQRPPEVNGPEAVGS